MEGGRKEGLFESIRDAKASKTLKKGKLQKTELLFPEGNWQF